MYCDCDYPHSSDYDPFNYERCTCPPRCYHFLGPGDLIGRDDDIESFLDEYEEALFEQEASD